MKPSATGRDLIQDASLTTTFLAHGVVSHTLYKSDQRSGRRKVRYTETWQTKEMVGEGSFGRVWRQSNDTGNERALKEIRKFMAPTRPGREPTPIDYRRELETAFKFSHGRYVHCFVESLGWFQDDKNVYISMEYLPHGDLQRFVGNSTLPEIEVQSISLQIVEGLVFMHSNGFVHRDLKPSNVLVVQHGPEWWVKLGDFGISKRASEATGFYTVIGTRDYLAPEVPTDTLAADTTTNDAYTVAVDMWALGQIVYRLLTQRSPLPSHIDLALFVTNQKGFNEEPLVQQGVTEMCRDFIRKLLVADPDKRLDAEAAGSHIWLREAAESEYQHPDDLTSQEHMQQHPASDQGSRLLHQWIVSSVDAGVDSSEATAKWTTRSAEHLMWSSSTVGELETTQNTLQRVSHHPPVSVEPGLTPALDLESKKSTVQATSLPLPEDNTEANSEEMHDTASDGSKATLASLISADFIDGPQEQEQSDEATDHLAKALFTSERESYQGLWPSIDKRLVDSLHKGQDHLERQQHNLEGISTDSEETDSVGYLLKKLEVFELSLRLDGSHLSSLATHIQRTQAAIDQGFPFKRSLKLVEQELNADLQQHRRLQEHYMNLLEKAKEVRAMLRLEGIFVAETEFRPGGLGSGEQMRDEHRKPTILGPWVEPTVPRSTSMGEKDMMVKSVDQRQESSHHADQNRLSISSNSSDSVASPGVEKAIAQHIFEGSSPDDLSFKRGEIITLEPQAVKDGSWWAERIGPIRSFFPSLVVMMLMGRGR